MASVVDLAVRVTTDARDAAAGLDSTTEKASKLGKVGSAAGKILAVGLLAAGAAAIKMTQAAAEDAAAAANLANTLKTVAGASDADVKATEDWIASKGRAFGVADDELRPALGALVTATKDVRKSQELATLAMDISAKSGKSLQSVSASLAKAYTTGSVTALAKYGVATKDAEGKSRSLAKVTSDLNLLYTGSAATAAETAAGKQKRLQVAFGELQEEIGYKLLPVLLKLSEYGLKVVEWISENQVVVGIFLGSLAALLASVWAVSKAVQAWRAISAAYTAVQWALNAALTANPIGLIVVGIAALIAGLILAYKHSETFRKVVDTAFRVVQKAAAFAFNWVKDHWKLLLAILTGPFGIAVGQIVTHRDKIIDAVRKVIDWIKDHWEALVVILGGPFGAALVIIIKNRDKIIDAIRGVIEWIRDHWRAIFDLLTGPWQRAVELILKHKDRLVEIARAARDGVVSAFRAMASPVLTMIDTVQRLIDKIASIDLPDLPNIPGLKVIAGSTADTATPTTATAAVVNNNYYVDMSGLLDTDQGADKLVGLLRRNARVSGGQVVLS